MNRGGVSSFRSSLPSDSSVKSGDVRVGAINGDPGLEKVRQENVMAMQCSLPWDEISDFDASATTIEFSDASTVVASPSIEPPSADSGLPVNKPTCVRLNMEDLKCFDVVERQFQQWGLTFRNAIALHPSNPAFPPRSGTTVLMGAPKNGLIEISFQYPVRFVSGFVTSSQRTILSAYDQQNQLLARAELTEPNLAGTDSKIPPNTQLSVAVPNIYRITFYAFDGCLTIDDLSFGL